MDNITKIMDHSDFVQVELAETLLADSGIKAFIMDKRDSSYPGLIGSVELYVANDEVEKAIALLKDGGYLD